VVIAKPRFIIRFPPVLLCAGRAARLFEGRVRTR
jgi:hypothetical protein